MLYDLYLMYRTYNIILHIHGIYVAYSFLCWSISSSYYYMNIFISYFYVSKPVLQISDKLDEVD